MQLSVSLVSFLGLAFATDGYVYTTPATTSSSGFLEGDACGVTSADFLDFDFGGEFRVAGKTGCTDAHGQSECFCAPDLKDQDPLSEWKWQCSNSVEFGPTEGKTCPANVPVPKGDEVISVGLRSANDRTCDQSLHPTGRPGDPVCPYSDCEQGGDTSAICGCVDLAAYGMGEGVEWVCMYSTCSCGENEDPTVGSMGDDSSSASTLYSSVFAVATLIMLMVRDTM